MKIAERKSIRELGFNEKQIQEEIIKDSSILGLGELSFISKERIQPQGGRLDILMRDEENKRYEIELQLGAVDESHIIRTIEYWDVERKRSPQYEHCAVIIAEDITSRFLNVISLFNGTIPIIAIQMNAVKVGDEVGLSFIKVLDEVKHVSDEDDVQEETNRNYWETQKGTPKTVGIADKLLKLINVDNETPYELKYNKFYIGLTTKDGKVNNFVCFNPRRKHTQVSIRLPQTEEYDQQFFGESSPLEQMDYDPRNNSYRVIVKPDNVESVSNILTELFAEARKIK